MNTQPQPGPLARRIHEGHASRPQPATCQLCAAQADTRPAWVRNLPTSTWVRPGGQSA